MHVSTNTDIVFSSMLSPTYGEYAHRLHDHSSLTFSGREHDDRLVSNLDIPVETEKHSI